MKIGIVDLGTNSVRFAVYHLNNGKSAQCIYKKKLMVRPGQGVFSTGRIKAKTAARLRREFRWFAKKAKALGANSVRAVATSAFRDAKNGKSLAREIFKDSGIRIEIISGRQEARLIALGILTHDRAAQGRCMLIDIGGGSTEISWCSNGKVGRGMSLPLGALRMQQIYLPADRQVHLEAKITSVLRMRKTITTELRRHHALEGRFKPEIAVGSSGTIRAVGRLIDRRHARNTRLFSKKAVDRAKPRLQFSKNGLSELINQMLPLTRAELSRIPGMERKRLDIILGGAILLHELMDRLGIERIKTSNYALRDGLIEDLRAKISRRKKL